MDFDNLTNEEIRAEIERLTAANITEERKPEPVVTKPQEEKKPEPKPVIPEPEVVTAPQDLFKPGEYNHEEYAKLLVQDGRAAQDYIEKVKYGQPVSQLIPALVQALIVNSTRLQNLEAQRFLDTTPDYTPNEENKAVIEQVIKARGWQPNFQTYKDAFAIAKAEGRIKVTEPKHEEPQQEARNVNSRPYVPPRTPGRSSETRDSGGDDTDILKWAETAPLESLHELLQKSGGFRH